MGTLLSTLNFAVTDSAYSVWTPATLSFAGTARSFDFSAAANIAGMDNISINAVPEPETYALMLAGLGLVGGVASRRKTQQVA